MRDGIGNQGPGNPEPNDISLMLARGMAQGASLIATRIPGVISPVVLEICMPAIASLISDQMPICPNPSFQTSKGMLSGNRGRREVVSQLREHLQHLLGIPRPHPPQLPVDHGIFSHSKLFGQILNPKPGINPGLA